ncbi:MAG: ABC transporter substrate-binding protein [Clostridia bacterium]|nr:ABC transporter substrate-binding protein [Clostridia bacterium]
MKEKSHKNSIITKSICIFLLFTFIFVSIIGCADSEEKAPDSVSTPSAEDVDGDNADDYQPEVTSAPIVYPFTFEDNAGNSVTLAHEPMYVVTVGSDITEAMFAFGRGIQIIGRSDEDSFPDDINSVPSIGSVNAPDAEKISALKPDAVLVSDKVPQEKVEEIRNKQLPVVVVNTPESIQEVYDMIRFLGRVLNGEKAAYSYAFQLESEISRVLLANAGGEIMKVCIVTDYIEESGKVISVKDDSKYAYYEDVVKAAGGKSVGIDEEPYAIVCVNEEIESKLYADTTLNKMSAVKRGRVETIENSLFEKRGPRCTLAIYAIANLLGITI